MEMHVCDNVGDHLIGNVYARFDWEDEAQAAVEALNKRWYAGEFDPFRARGGRREKGERGRNADPRAPGLEQAALSSLNFRP